VIRPLSPKVDEAAKACEPAVAHIATCGEVRLVPQSNKDVLEMRSILSGVDDKTEKDGKM
jgi:hypothetical protein